MIETYIQRKPTEVEAIQFNGKNTDEIERSLIVEIKKIGTKYILNGTDNGISEPLHVFDFVVKDRNSIHIYSPYIMDLLYKKK